MDPRNQRIAEIAGWEAIPCDSHKKCDFKHWLLDGEFYALPPDYLAPKNLYLLLDLARAIYVDGDKRISTVLKLVTSVSSVEEYSTALVESIIEASK